MKLCWSHRIAEDFLCPSWDIRRHNLIFSDSSIPVTSLRTNSGIVVSALELPDSRYKIINSVHYCVPCAGVTVEALAADGGAGIYFSLAAMLRERLNLFLASLFLSPLRDLSFAAIPSGVIVFTENASESVLG